MDVVAHNLAPFQIRKVEEMADMPNQKRPLISASPVALTS
jgi:hypothetical protein